MGEISEAQAVARRWGKWSDPGVPHKGWSRIDTADLGSDQDNRRKCEMCEAMDIRYVHVMTHPDYDGELECGCVCAGHMEDDLQLARHREDGMQSIARRRSRFPQLKGWRVSMKGNPWMTYHDWHVVIFPKGRGYGGLVERQGRKLFVQRMCPTVDAAKLAAFDILMKAENSAGLRAA
jgi:hypothetical protein